MQSLASAPITLSWEKLEQVNSRSPSECLFNTMCLLVEGIFTTYCRPPRIAQVLFCNKSEN